MSLDYRLVQFFLTEDDDIPAIYEVRVSNDTKTLFCTCPGFRGRKMCQHVRFVKSKLTASDDKNHYLMRLDDNTPDHLIDEISEMTVDEYRMFIAQYGMIEVI